MQLRQLLLHSQRFLNLQFIILFLAVLCATQAEEQVAITFKEVSPSVYQYVADKNKEHTGFIEYAEGGLGNSGTLTLHAVTLNDEVEEGAKDTDPFCSGTAYWLVRAGVKTNMDLRPTNVQLETSIR